MIRGMILFEMPSLVGEFVRQSDVFPVDGFFVSDAWMDFSHKLGHEVLPQIVSDHFPIFLESYNFNCEPIPFLVLE